MATRQITEQEAKPSLYTRVREFINEVMVEMNKVTWPSKDELKTSTSVVLMLLAAVSAIIYLYDVVFQIVIVGLFRRV